MDAVVDGRSEQVTPLCDDLSPRAAGAIDTFERCLYQLAYHGELCGLVEAMRRHGPA